MAAALRARWRPTVSGRAHRTCTQQHGLARMRPVSARSPNAVAAANSVASLTEQVEQLEQQLHQMFNSGGVMPKASVVAKMRAEIATLKAELAELVGGGRAPAAGPTPARSSSPAVERLQMSGAESDDAVEAFKKAEMLLQGVTGAYAMDPDWDPVKQAEYEAELAMLAEENERLRNIASALLTRQALLEELAAQKGITIPHPSQQRRSA